MHAICETILLTVFELKTGNAATSKSCRNT